MRIAILTSPNQWFIPYAEKFHSSLENSQLFFNHEHIDEEFDILFILSYHRILKSEHLKHGHNIVIHASALPEGKGWAPMFWQILEGKNEIPFTMFEASEGVDDGDIYMQEVLHLNGYELNSELRFKQANFIIRMCMIFLENYDSFNVPFKQQGNESFYSKRTDKDSELDIYKTIDAQFNLLRIVDNEYYPAYFYKHGKKYILKIEEVNDEDR